MGIATSICQSIRIGYFPVFAVILLLGATIAVPGASQDGLEGSDNGSAAAQEGSALRVTKSDYERDVSEIHGEDAFAYVVLDDPRLSEPDMRSTVAVEVSSETDSGGVMIDLLETGIDTGVFYGGFGFSKSSSDDPHAHPVLGRIGVNAAGEWQNARIQIGEGQAGETVELRTQGSPSQNTTVQWFDSVSAEITVTNQFNRMVPLNEDDLPNENPFIDIVGYGEQFNIVVEDPDLNRDPDRVEQYHDLLRAYSDSQPEGETLILTEIGDSDSGRFQATLEFEPELNAGNRHLFVQQADRIHLEYREPHTPRGVEENHRLPEDIFWVFREAADGSIRTERSIYFGETEEGNIHGDDRAVIIIDDPGERHRDGSEAGVIDVDVQSSQDSGTITATQLGGQSSKFIATLGFTTGAAQLEDLDDGEIPLLPVSDPQDTITVRYTDRDEDNIMRTRSHSFTWSRMDTADIQVAESQALFKGTHRDIVVRVQDLDSNNDPNIQDTITVHAKSTSDAVNGLRVPLLETGMNTGIFTGNFRFTTGTTGNDALKVRDGDQVVVEYRDRLTEDGSFQIVRSDAMYWRESTQAEIRTDFTDYYADYEDGDDGLAFSTNALITVQDKDRSHPLQRNQIQATAIAIDGGSVDITLLEVGTDTGLFVGPLNLSSFLEDHLDGNPDGHIEFQLQYREPLAEGGTRLVETDRLKLWDAPEGDDVIIRFEYQEELFGTSWSYERDRVFMPTPQAPNTKQIQVAVYGSGDSFLEWNETAKTLSANVFSERCPDPLTIILKREGDSNRFRTEDDGMMLSTANGSCNNQDEDPVRVSQSGDTVTVEIVRDDGFTVVSHEAETRAEQGERISFVESDTSSDSLPRVAGLNKPVDILLDRGDHGKYSGARLFVETDVWSRNQETPIRVLLAETSADSGAFRGAIQFTDDNETGSSAGSLLGKVPVRNDADLVPKSEVPQYGLYDAVLAGVFDATERAAVLWFPAADADLEVAPTAYGSGTFDVRLVDGDGLPHRKINVQEAEEGTIEFDFEERYIPGTEHVYVHRTEKHPIDSDDSITLDSAVGVGGGERSAKEAVADSNRDGQVDCRDIAYAPRGGPFGVVCNDSNSDVGNGTIVFNTGTSSQPVVTTSYMYRAERVNSCPEDGPLDDDQVPFQYVRVAQGVRLCAPPGGEDEDNVVELDYTTRDRIIAVRGPTETELVALSYSASQSNARDDGKSVFTGEVREETFRQSDNNRIHVPEDRTQIEFYYLDPVQEVDGRPGSLSVGHFRSNLVEAVWRDAQKAEVDVMTHDFNGPAGDFVYGPGVPVEVRDPDSSRFDRRDTITVEAAGNGNIMTVTLRETGEDTGVFRGVVPADDLMEEAGSITVTYRDPQDSRGRPSLRSTVTDWRPAATAGIAVLNEGEEPNMPFRGPLASFKVQITDVDANRDSNRLERIDVRLVSESDPVGELVRPEETGPSTGVFEASVLRFETVHNPGSGRVFVQDGDEFWVTYVDQLTLSGTQQVLESQRRVWSDANDGVVEFDRPFQIGTGAGDPRDAPVGLEKLARAGATITDHDRSTNASRINVITFADGSATVAEDEDGNDIEADIGIGRVMPDGTAADGVETITFVETGHNTGAFIAVFSFADSEFADEQENVAPIQEDMPTGFARVPVQPGDWFRVTYTDPDPMTTSGPQSFNEESRWFVEGFGVVRFDRQGYGEFEQEPRVTVYDAHAPEDGVDIVVSSNADPNGISVTLDPRVDAPDGGIYTSTFALSATASVRALFVHDEDELEARYQDVSFSRGATHTALFIEGLNEPPVTSMVTDPEFPDGANGWFVTEPTVSLETDRSAEHIEVTHFRRDGGPIQEYDGPMKLGQGIHVFEFWSIDQIGNVEERKTRTIHVSLTDPVAQVAGFEATPRPEGKIELTWAGVSGKLNPMEFGEYRIFRDSLRNQVGATDTESFTDLPPADGTYTYFVYVANAAGRHNEDLAVSTQGLSDRIPPVVESFEVTPQELHDDLGEDTVTANLTVTEGTLDDVERVFLRVTDPFGEVRHEVPMEPGATERDWHLRYSGFNISGVYRLTGVAADVADNEGTGNHTVRFFAEDRQAPRIVSIPDEQEFEADLNVTVRDNDRGVALIEYSVEGGPFVGINIPDEGAEGDHCLPGPCEVGFTIPARELSLGHNVIDFRMGDANDPPNVATVNHTVFVAIPRDDPQAPPGVPEISTPRPLVEYGESLRFIVQSETPLRLLVQELDTGLHDNLIPALDFETGTVDIDLSDYEPGEHTIRIRAANEAGPVAQEFTFYLLDEGIPLPPERVAVSFDDRGRPVVEWSASPSDPSKVGGYLVHRSSSPWTVIAATEESARAHVDTTAEDSQEYIYTVTAYGTNGEGYLEPGTDSSGLGWIDYADAQTIQTENIKVVTTGLLWLVLILLGIFVVLAIVYVNRNRIFGAMRRREGDGYIGGDESEGDHADVKLQSSPYETGDPSGGSGSPPADERWGSTVAASSASAAPLAQKRSTTPASDVFGMERHQIRCPSCSNVFHVNGQLPIMASCTNCGGKGILR